jgi:hypothetical protein
MQYRFQWKYNMLFFYIFSHRDQKPGILLGWLGFESQWRCDTATTDLDLMAHRVVNKIDGSHTQKGPYYTQRFSTIHKRQRAKWLRCSQRASVIHNGPLLLTKGLHNSQWASTAYKGLYPHNGPPLLKKPQRCQLNKIFQLHLPDLQLYVIKCNCMYESMPDL